MSRADLLTQEIQDRLNQHNQLRDAISNTRKRRAALGSQYQVPSGSGLRKHLGDFLPPSLMPGNVGGLNAVSWDFYYSTNFDLSTFPGWPLVTNAFRQTASFQVSQEAAHMFMAISRHNNDYDGGGDLGPWQIELRDRQSSRFFNNAPIPIQMIGQHGWPTILPVPMLIMPNAFMDITMTNFLANGVTQNVGPTSTGLSQFTLYGYRIRVEDADKVLSSIFMK